MKRIHIILLFLVAIFQMANSAAWKVSDMQQPRAHDANNFVWNADGILSQSAVSRMNSMLVDINEKTGAQVAVAVVDDFDAVDIDNFASKLFESWGLGEKGADNGVLLVVARAPRKYAFRTGRGIGSVLTDANTGEIARGFLIPNLQAGDFDKALVSTVEELNKRMTTPRAVAEIKEMSARAKSEEDLSLWDILTFYFWWCIVLTVVLAVWEVYKVKTTGNVERHQRYVKLHPMSRILYGLSFVGAGLPFLVYLPFKQYINNLRNGEHLCPNCATKMFKLDEVKDNERLTPAQDAEERFNSVDYDVWECPNCGEEDIYAFVNQDSSFVECPNCHARTARYVRDRVLKMPTTASEGLAVKEFDCLNCKKRSQKPYKLPRNVNVGAAAAAASIPFILGGFGRGGGGGFGGGGSFGGGHTGGGGSSGGW